MKCPFCRTDISLYCEFRFRTYVCIHCTRESNHKGPHVACGHPGGHCAFIEYVENNNELILLKPRKFL